MPSQPRFLDTNVLLRLLTRDDEDKARSARELIRRVERGEERLVTSSLVIFEVIFTLQSFYRMPRARIADILLPLLGLRGLEVPDREIFGHALELYADSGLPFADAHSVASMEARGLYEIYTWDTDFDSIRGVIRVEPQFTEGAES